MQMYLDWELSRGERTHLFSPLYIFCNNHKLRCDNYPAFELFDELSALKLYQAKQFFLWIKDLTLKINSTTMMIVSKQINHIFLPGIHLSVFGFPMGLLQRYDTEWIKNPYNNMVFQTIDRYFVNT